MKDRGKALLLKDIKRQIQPLYDEKQIGRLIFAALLRGAEGRFRQEHPEHPYCSQDGPTGPLPSETRAWVEDAVKQEIEKQNRLHSAPDNHAPMPPLSSPYDNPPELTARNEELVAERDSIAAKYEALAVEKLRWEGERAAILQREQELTARIDQLMEELSEAARFRPSTVTREDQGGNQMVDQTNHLLGDGAPAEWEERYQELLDKNTRLEYTLLHHEDWCLFSPMNEGLKAQSGMTEPGRGSGALRAGAEEHPFPGDANWPPQNRRSDQGQSPQFRIDGPGRRTPGGGGYADSPDARAQEQRKDVIYSDPYSPPRQSHSPKPYELLPKRRRYKPVEAPTYREWAGYPFTGNLSTQDLIDNLVRDVGIKPTEEVFPDEMDPDPSWMAGASPVPKPKAHRYPNTPSIPAYVHPGEY